MKRKNGTQKILEVVHSHAAGTRYYRDPFAFQYVTRNELAQAAGLTPKTTKEYIRRLIEFLESIGTDAEVKARKEADEA